MQALNQCLCEEKDSAFVVSVFNRKRLFYQLQQQIVRRTAARTIKELRTLQEEVRRNLKAFTRLVSALKTGLRGLPTCLRRSAQNDDGHKRRLEPLPVGCMYSDVVVGDSRQRAAGCAPPFRTFRGSKVKRRGG